MIRAILAALLLSGGTAFASEVTYAGGDGSSFPKAVLIRNATEATGVAAEYTYLAKSYPGYRMKLQSLVNKGKRMYDVLDIETKDGPKKVYFDITEFYGKF